MANLSNLLLLQKQEQEVAKQEPVAPDLQEEAQYAGKSPEQLKKEYLDLYKESEGGKLATKSTYDPRKQLDGYRRRIEAAGLEFDKFVDTRNPVEQMLNLRKDQNALFDVFEVINRPQQAFFGAIKGYQEADNPLAGAAEGFGKGLTGQQDYRFKEILHNAGVQDSAEKLGLDDVIGFAGDIFLDPVDIAFIPIAAASKTKKVLAETAVEVGRTAGKIEQAQKVTDTLVNLRLLKQDKANEVLAAIANGMIDPVKYLDDMARGVKTTQNPVEFGFSAVKQGVIKAVGEADEMIGRIASHIDEGADTLKKGDKLFSERYTDIKQMFKSGFNAASAIPKGMMEEYYRKVGGEKYVRKQMMLKYKNSLEMMSKYAKKFGVSTDDLNKMLMESLEMDSMLGQQTSIRQMLLHGFISAPLDKKTKDEFLNWAESYLGTYKAAGALPPGSVVPPAPKAPKTPTTPLDTPKARTKSVTKTPLNDAAEGVSGDFSKIEPDAPIAPTLPPTKKGKKKADVLGEAKARVPDNVLPENPIYIEFTPEALKEHELIAYSVNPETLTPRKIEQLMSRLTTEDFAKLKELFGVPPKTKRSLFREFLYNKIGKRAPIKQHATILSNLSEDTTKMIGDVLSSRYAMKPEQLSKMGDEEIIARLISKRQNMLAYKQEILANGGVKTSWNLNKTPYTTEEILKLIEKNILDGEIAIQAYLDEAGEGAYASIRSMEKMPKLPGSNYDSFIMRVVKPSEDVIDGAEEWVLLSGHKQQMRGTLEEINEQYPVLFKDRQAGKPISKTFKTDVRTNFLQFTVSGDEGDAVIKFGVDGTHSGVVDDRVKSALDLLAQRGKIFINTGTGRYLVKKTTSNKYEIWFTPDGLSNAIKVKEVTMKTSIFNSVHDHSFQIQKTQLGRTGAGMGATVPGQFKRAKMDTPSAEGGPILPDTSEIKLPEQQPTVPNVAQQAELPPSLYEEKDFAKFRKQERMPFSTTKEGLNRIKSELALSKAEIKNSESKKIKELAGWQGPRKGQKWFDLNNRLNSNIKSARIRLLNAEKQFRAFKAKEIIESAVSGIELRYKQTKEFISTKLLPYADGGYVPYDVDDFKAMIDEQIALIENYLKTAVDDEDTAKFLGTLNELKAAGLTEKTYQSARSRVITEAKNYRDIYKARLDKTKDIKRAKYVLENTPSRTFYNKQIQAKNEALEALDALIEQKIPLNAEQIATRKQLQEDLAKTIIERNKFDEYEYTVLMEKAKKKGLKVFDEAVDSKRLAEIKEQLKVTPKHTKEYSRLIQEQIDLKTAKKLSHTEKKIMLRRQRLIDFDPEMQALKAQHVENKQKLRLIKEKLKSSDALSKEEIADLRQEREALQEINKKIRAKIDPEKAKALDEALEARHEAALKLKDETIKPIEKKKLENKKAKAEAVIDPVKAKKKSLKEAADDIILEDKIDEAAQEALYAETPDDVGKIFVSIFDRKTLDSMFEEVVLENGVTVYMMDPTMFKNRIIMEIERVRNNLPDNLLPEFDASMDKLFNATRYYSADDIARVKGYSTTFGADFEDLKQTIMSDYKDSLKYIDDMNNTKFATMGDRGIVHHAITDERREAPFRKFEKEWEGSQVLFGNMGFAKERKYRMSAFEANMVSSAGLKFAIDNGIIKGPQAKYWKSHLGEKLFQEGFMDSFADFIKQGPKTAKAVSILDMTTAMHVFDPTNELVLPTIDAMQRKVPKRAGYTLISKNELAIKLQQMSRYLENTDFVDGALKTLKNNNLFYGDSIMIESNIFEMIGVLSDPQKSNDLWRVMDAANGLFKSGKLMSPGFHFRNWMGNLTNLAVSGANIPMLYDSMSIAAKAMEKGDGLFQKVQKLGIGSLADEEKMLYFYYDKFLRNGFHEVASEMYDLSPELLEKIGAGKAAKNLDPIRALMKFGVEKNEQVDKFFRMSAMIYGENHPELLQKLGLESSVDFVRRVLFDPNDLTQFEKKYMKRLIPFYTFTKKNLAYQFRNIFDNPQAYKKIIDTLDASWDLADMDAAKVEEYKRENMWIPLPIKNKKGEYTVIKTNLPISDLGEMVSDPLKRTVSMTSPLIKAPFELAANKQMFTGMPIQDFEGQKGYNLPFVDRKTEYLVGQTGADVPLAAGYTVGKTLTDLVKGQADPVSALSGLTGNTIFGKGNYEGAQKRQAYEDLDKVREKMKYLKQQGVEVPTLLEIQNKAKQDKLNAIRNRVQSLK